MSTPLANELTPLQLMRVRTAMISHTKLQILQIEITHHAGLRSEFREPLKDQANDFASVRLRSIGVAKSHRRGSSMQEG